MLLWLPDGGGLLLTAREGGAFSPQQIWRVAYPGGEVRKLTSDLLDYTITSLTADAGTLLANQNKTFADIWITPATPGGKPTQVTFSKYDGHSVNWTPGGKVIFISEAGGDDSIWVMNADGSDRRQLTSGFDISPAASPDGRYVVFSSSRSGVRNLWRVDIDGNNLRQLTNHGSEDGYPRYTADGKWIVFYSWRSGRLAIWKMPAEGGEAVQLTTRAATYSEPSPDSKQVACIDVEAPPGTTRVLLLPIEGGEPTRVIDLPAGSLGPVKWTADGRALTFISVRDAAANIWKFPLDNGQPVQLTSLKPEPLPQAIGYYALSPNGKQFAITRLTNASPDIVLISNFK
jgi:Tol biopolymer transport system component